ncbi:ABC transporter substrate-binding protein [Chitinophaga sedimenti]|uniref:ABC transporter substrate-binding protein n=1 Tax=Chitinophaga sedimenti TaxID=2033606 RepID=UPI002002D7FD|nr:ABC transporter substrate-binding protein [Chitinophaga sedimenti]MCK7555100.1 ABC transporter substrate-binding protein [Chitinophaga sedimenti]
MKRQVLAGSIQILVMLLLAGCGEKRGSDKMVFRYNQQEGLPTLDPAFAKTQATTWVAHQLFNTLVEPDSLLNIVPSLAKSWDVSPDRLVYTFHLRDDVYFHDNEVFPNGKGRKMTAADVVYSFKRVMDPAVASTGAWIFNDKIDPATGFKAIDDTTFQLTLQHPFHPIMGILSMQYCSIVPKEVVAKYGKDFRKHPCGTGPFRFHFWDEGQGLVLHRHPNYFEKDEQGNRLPYLDAVQVSFVDSKGTEFLLFRQQQLDFVNEVEPSFKDEVLTKTGNLKKEWEGKIVLEKPSFLNTEYFGILMDTANAQAKSSPLKHRLLRQAINYGIDRRKMMTYLRNSLGKPANSGFVPYGLPSFDEVKVPGYEFNPTKALELLARAGYPNGKGLPPIKLLSIPNYSDMANFVANQLQALGIPIQVEIIQKGTLIDQVSKSQVPFFRGSWIADYPDAESYLAMFYSKNPAPPNYTRYNNPVFDKLYEQAIRENNDSLRYQLYQQMDRLLIADAPIVPLFYDQVMHLLQPNVKGLVNNGLNMLELRRVSIR